MQQYILLYILLAWGRTNYLRDCLSLVKPETEVSLNKADSHHALIVGGHKAGILDGQSHSQPLTTIANNNDEHEHGEH